MWNLFMVKYFRPLESSINKKHHFLFLFIVRKYFVYSIFVVSHQRRKFFSVEFFPNYGMSDRDIVTYNEPCKFLMNCSNVNEEHIMWLYLQKRIICTHLIFLTLRICDSICVRPTALTFGSRTILSLYFRYGAKYIWKHLRK